MTNKRAKIGPQMDEPYAPESFSLDPKKGRLMCEIPFSEIKAGGFYQFEIMQAAAELHYLFTGSSKAIAFWDKFFRYEFIDLRSAFIENDYKNWPLRRYKLLQEDKEKIDFFEYSEQLQSLLVSIEKAWDRETHVSLEALFKTFPAAPIMSQALYHQFLDDSPAFIMKLPKYPGYKNYLALLDESSSFTMPKGELEPGPTKLLNLLKKNQSGLTTKTASELLPDKEGNPSSENSVRKWFSTLRQLGLAEARKELKNRKIWFLVP